MKKAMSTGVAAVLAWSLFAAPLAGHGGHGGGHEGFFGALHVLFGAGYAAPALAVVGCVVAYALVRRARRHG